MKKNLFLFLSLFLSLSLPALADSSSIEALTVGSGLSSGGELVNFGVLGDNVAGVIYGADSVSGVGLSAMIYTPLLPQAGAATPTVTTMEGRMLCYPSPFNPDTEVLNIAYRMNQDADVLIYIFDLTGRRVRTIATSSTYRAEDGYSRASWNGRTGFGDAVPTGVYLLQLVSNGRVVGRTKAAAMR